MNPLGFTFLITIGLLIFVLPRQLVFIPFIIAVCYITFGQQLVIWDLNFTVIRIFILLAWIRLIIRGEIRGFKLNTIDKAVIWWVVISCIAHTLLWQTSGAFIYRLGRGYNAAGLYFLFRILIRDIDEIEKIIKISAIIILPLSIIMIFEMFSGRNIFSIFGGVAETSWFRDGSVRAQGPFMYAGLAGTFGAIIMPFYAALWFSDKARFNAIVGCVAATIITITSHSSGPLMAYFAGILGLIMWRFHKRMRMVQYAILFTLISLHMVMKAPVWYLMAKVGNLTGGTGWHRSYIIDMAIKYFNEWWLFGTKDTSTWMPYLLPSKTAYDELSRSSDITNQFILEGVEGGFISMLLFIIIIILCFRQIGISLRLNENQPFSKRIIIWSLGASLFANVVAFFSVSYFDQILVFWYMLLAMISALSMQRQQRV
jgi:hypothetical protein